MEATTSSSAPAVKTKPYRLKHGRSFLDGSTGKFAEPGSVVQLTDAQYKSFKDAFIPGDTPLPPPVDAEGDDKEEDGDGDDDEEHSDGDEGEEDGDGETGAGQKAPGDGEENNIEEILARKEAKKAAKRAAKKLKKQQR